MIKRYIRPAGFAVLTAAAFFMDLQALADGEEFKKLFTAAPLTLAMVCVLLGGFYRRCNHKPDRLAVGLSIVFSRFMVFGYSYLKTGTYQLVFGSVPVFLAACVAFAGYFVFFRTLIAWMEARLPALRLGGGAPRRLRWFDTHPFLVSLCVLLVAWSIYMVAFYPAILSPDPSNQIKQFFNLDTHYSEDVVLLDENMKMTNHHPVLHTVLLGGCLSLGRMLGSDNLGLFFYSLLQTLVLASALSCTILYMHRLGLPFGYRIGTLAIYALVPMFPLYAMSAVKDVLFTSFVIFYVILLFDTVKNREQKAGPGRLAMLFGVTLLMALLRSNGTYLVWLSLPFLIVACKGNRLRLGGVLLVFTVLVQLYSGVLLPALGITGGSVREALSIPFQQTARYVKEHADELTEEEIQVIDRVLGYEDLAERYKPNISDPVKNEFNKYATKDDLKAYFGVWLKGLIRHPVTYLEATINNVYGYFYPGKLNWYIYYKFDDRITQNDLTDYHYIASLQPLRDALADYGEAYPYLPVIGLLANIGFNVWALLYAALYTLKANKKYIVAFLPLLAAVLVCVASPVNAYFRDAMPYVFAMPLVIACFVYLRKEEKNA